MKNFLYLILILFPQVLFGQDSLRSGVKYGFLPILSYNSDNGLLFGGDITQYNYQNITPFKAFTKGSVMYLTNGAYLIWLQRDQVKTFGKDIRTKFELFSSVNYSNYYLGDTEKNNFDKSIFDTTSFYSFQSFRMHIGGNSRIPIRKGQGINRFDFKTSLNFIYETPWGNPVNNFINSSEIGGSDGAFTSMLGFGLVYEKRDFEFRAQKGYFFDIGFNYSPAVISTNHLVENYIKAIGLFPISTKIPITIASQINLQNTVGDVPYWLMPNLGGGNSLRGFIYRRFTSDNAISYSLELRSWLLKLPYQNMEFGMNLFMDGGRVFRNNNWEAIFINHNHTVGIGGVMSIFTPDFILKIDLGISNEGIGLYFGTGYSF